MTPHARFHVYELYHAWRACYARSPTVGDVCRLTGYPRGLVWAWLWRMGVLRRIQ